MFELIKQWWNSTCCHDWEAVETIDMAECEHRADKIIKTEELGRVPIMWKDMLPNGITYHSPVSNSVCLLCGAKRMNVDKAVAVELARKRLFRDRQTRAKAMIAASEESKEHKTHGRSETTTGGAG